MKKIFSVVMVAALGVVIYTSCTKGGKLSGNSSYICACNLKSVVTGNDSLVSQTTFGGFYSHDKAAIQCTDYQKSIEYRYPGVYCTIN